MPGLKQLITRESNKYMTASKERDGKQRQKEIKRVANNKTIFEKIKKLSDGVYTREEAWELMHEAGLNNCKLPKKIKYKKG